MEKQTMMYLFEKLIALVLGSRPKSYSNKEGNSPMPLSANLLTILFGNDFRILRPFDRGSRISFSAAVF